MECIENQGTTFKRITHVVFDLDGLILDTDKWYEQIDEAVVGKYAPVPKDLKFQLLGLSDDDVARKIVEICDIPITGDEYKEEAKKHLYFLRNSELLPGAERLIRHLAEHKIPIAVATSSGHSSVVEKTWNHKELFGLFHHVVKASTDPEVKSGKPAPDVFLVCAGRFKDKPKPEQCLVFEDAPSGVIAANKAGMQVVLVPDKDLHDEKKKGATLVLKSLLDFKPELFGLPPFPQVVA